MSDTTQEPSAVDALAHQQEARRLIREGEWTADGKDRSIEVEDGGVAKAMQKELQRYVQGHTPAIRPSGDNFIVTVPKTVLGEGQKQISKQIGA